MENKNKLFLLTLLGATALAAPDALSQVPPPPGRGFTPPGTSFGSNPFAGKPANNKSDDLFDLDEEDEFDEGVDDINDDLLRRRMEQRLKERPDSAPTAGGGGSGGSHGSGIDFSQAGNDVGASFNAGASGRIQPGQKNSCLKLDPYTGYGPDIIKNFDFPDADIVEIAKTLGRLTCLNFLLDKDVKGRISVVSNSQITVGDAWKAFLTALDVNGFSLIPSGAYIRIARQRDAKDKQIKTYSGALSPDNDLYITRVLPLKYIDAEEVSRVFRNFMPPNTRIISYNQTNTLIITDTGSNIKKLVDMISLLDVEGFDEGLEVIKIKHASAQEIAKLIDQLLPGGQAPGGPPGVPGIPRFRSGPGSFAARKTKEGGVISHIIPDDRTNAVIVSANAKGLDQVKELIRKLDAKVTASQGGSKIHVVYLQFADAEQVAQTLNNLASGAGKASAPLVATPGVPATTASLFEGNIKISADKPTNSLVITGTPSDFQTVSRVISKLDVPRDQVYVEAVIMEMSLNKEFELGTSVAAPSSGIGFLPNDDFAKFLVNPFSVPGVLLGFQSGKGGKTFTLPGTSQQVTISNVAGLIKALQQNTNGNVLATPQILTLDNQQAEIEISENIPLPTVTNVQGSSTTGVTREKVALTLKIKPQINKISNFVKLDIDQKLEDIDNRPLPSAVSNLAFATTSRASKTTVVVQDGDTVVMGGLVRDKVIESATKVPLLGDIPVLGWLFRSKRTSTSKTNLLVFMTPQIIKQYQAIRKVLDKKLRQRDEFLERNAGGDDPFQEAKLDLVRSLPAVQDLKSGGRVENAEVDSADSSDDENDADNSQEAPAREVLPHASENTEQPGFLRHQIMQSPPAGTVQSGNMQALDGATAPGVLQPPGQGASPANTMGVMPSPSAPSPTGTGASAPALPAQPSTGNTGGGSF